MTKALLPLGAVAVATILASHLPQHSVLVWFTALAASALATFLLPALSHPQPALPSPPHHNHDHNKAGEGNKAEEGKKAGEGKKAAEGVRPPPFLSRVGCERKSSVMDMEDMARRLRMAKRSESLSSIEPAARVEMVSCLDMFKIGVGPSSSHTVGPMKAACQFVGELREKNMLPSLSRVYVDLYGSLALTGVGHGTDRAVVMGLMGHESHRVKPLEVQADVDEVRKTKQLVVGLVVDNKKNKANGKCVEFEWRRDVLFHTSRTLEFHSNALTFNAEAADGRTHSSTYYSIGGGFIVHHSDIGKPPKTDSDKMPFPFSRASELLDICYGKDMTIAEVVMANENALRPEEETIRGLLERWGVMQDCVRTGCSHEGVLPGPLQVRRRAMDLHDTMMATTKRKVHEDAEKLQGTNAMKWLSVYAMAVSEENAAGSRVVTAPTNGAAGIIPAVLHYYVQHHDHTEQDVIDFLLTATAIGHLFKAGASISGAEAGCQGEVGVASAMAAAGLAAVIGGTPNEIENAAEIAMEHHLGMTCDPVAGLVQVPCIERNTMGSVKAVNAVVLAMYGDGDHIVPLDRVIRAMKRTGEDMKDKYKETSRGGLALEFEFHASVSEPVC